MNRDELVRLVEDYSARGGMVLEVDERIYTVDWRESKLRKAARATGKRGHAKRKQKKGKWIVRRGLKSSTGIGGFDG